MARTMSSFSSLSSRSDCSPLESWDRASMVDWSLIRCYGSSCLWWLPLPAPETPIMLEPKLPTRIDSLWFLIKSFKWWMTWLFSRSMSSIFFLSWLYRSWCARSFFWKFSCLIWLFLTSSRPFFLMYSCKSRICWLAFSNFSSRGTSSPSELEWSLPLPAQPAE